MAIGLNRATFLALALLCAVSGRAEAALALRPLQVQTSQQPIPAQERVLLAHEVGTEARRFEARAGEGREFTWWLPPQADAYTLPLSAGVRVEANDASAIRWLRQGSPWELRELPLLALRYGDRTLVVIVPWPHYAQLVFENRVGVRFSFPPDRNSATPCDIVAQVGRSGDSGSRQDLSKMATGRGGHRGAASPSHTGAQGERICR